ncbi:MAG: glycoside hydrolase family 9 protein [Solirubrobacterales bacterium]
MRPPRALLAIAAGAAALTAAGAAHAAPAPRIQVGGPSSPSEPKVAIVGGPRSLKGDRFKVRDATGRVVLRGRLRRAPGTPAPWDHAYRADLSRVTEPGRYRVRVGKLTSRPWTVTDGAESAGIDAILAYFRANRDGTEPSPIHGPAHLNDAVIHPDSPVLPGQAIDMTGGWMDAGDMLHFTQTTAFATALLEAAARLAPSDAPALTTEADVGLRWLLKAHPAPGVFVAQVGDERDHDLGFRDPADDDMSADPGIGIRFAYPEIGGDLGGKAATALALGYIRTGDSQYLAAAEDWYAAGLDAARPARPLKRAGYPAYAANFYAAPNWKDSMASAAVELYRASCLAGACDGAYSDQFRDILSDSKQTGPYAAMGAVDDFASFGEAEACGAFGPAPEVTEDMRTLGCRLLKQNGAIASRQAASNAFGMPGYFSWGTTAQNGAAGALAALSTAAPGAPAAKACRTAAGARDYLLGRNPYGASFVVGYGPRAPEHPHHWGSVFGKGIPAGAVVGGPAPRGEIRSQGFPVRGKLGTSFATYEDRRADYVTSEPAIDYSAPSILLLAALRAHC